MIPRCVLQEQRRRESVGSPAGGQRPPLSITALAVGHGNPRSQSNKATATQFKSRHHLSKRQAVVVENSLDVTRVVMEYLTKKLPNVVVAMPK